MKITNKFGLPESLVEAVSKDPYDPGDGDISVTALIDAPQIRKLLEVHGDEIEEDVVERVWSLLGQGVHAVLERATDSGHIEERVYFEHGGVKVGGQPDLSKDGVLTDYKVTSVWTLILNDGLGRPEWVEQVNLYAHAMRENGHEITKAQVVVILRDWHKSQAWKDEYPDIPVQVIEIPLWTPAAVKRFLDEKVVDQFVHSDRPCTDSERWARYKYRVEYPNSSKRGKNFNKEEDATKVALAHGGVVEKRPYKYIRCESYCPARAVCPQWAADNGGPDEEGVKEQVG